MRQIIFGFTLIICFNIYSQNKFLLKSNIGVIKIALNNKPYVIDSLGLKIKTSYPKFDTLIFLSESGNSTDKVICNFKPDSSYNLTYACCGSLDVIPTYKFNLDSLKYWDAEKDFLKIQNQLMDKPFLSIKTKQSPKDSIYAWHSDAACLTEHQLIDTSIWELGIPPKCFYWNNITPIVFFKTDAKSNDKRDKNVEEFLNKKNIIELNTIYLRLFDNQKFILTFDEVTHTIKLEYDLCEKNIKQNIKAYHKTNSYSKKGDLAFEIAKYYQYKTDSLYKYWLQQTIDNNNSDYGHPKQISIIINKLFKTGFSYYGLKDYKTAEVYFAKAIKGNEHFNSSIIDSMTYLYYGISLFNNNRIDEAKDVLIKFKNKYPTNILVDEYLEKCNSK